MTLRKKEREKNEKEKLRKRRGKNFVLSYLDGLFDIRLRCKAMIIPSDVGQFQGDVSLSIIAYVKILLDFFFPIRNKTRTREGGNLRVFSSFFDSQADQNFVRRLHYHQNWNHFLSLCPFHSPFQICHLSCRHPYPFLFAQQLCEPILLSTKSGASIRLL